MGVCLCVLNSYNGPTVEREVTFLLMQLSFQGATRMARQPEAVPQPQHHLPHTIKVFKPVSIVVSNGNIKHC